MRKLISWLFILCCSIPLKKSLFCWLQLVIILSQAFHHTFLNTHTHINWTFERWCHLVKAFIYKPYLSPTLSLTGHCSEKFSPRQKMLLFLILASGASADCGFKGPCPRDGERSLKIKKKCLIFKFAGLYPCPNDCGMFVQCANGIQYETDVSYHDL